MLTSLELTMAIKHGEITWEEDEPHENLRNSDGV
jgi:hypothetical protein